MGEALSLDDLSHVAQNQENKNQRALSKIYFYNLFNSQDEAIDMQS